MHLRPRHFILIAVLLALAVYNVMRLRSVRRVAPVALAPRSPLPSGPRPESPAWTAFDRAAAQRDAPENDFAPALTALHKQTASGGDPDLSGCSTWLGFYRQGILHPSRDRSWQDRSTEHLDSCVKLHRDLSS